MPIVIYIRNNRLSRHDRAAHRAENIVISDLVLGPSGIGAGLLVPPNFSMVSSTATQFVPIEQVVVHFAARLALGGPGYEIDRLNRVINGIRANVDFEPLRVDAREGGYDLVNGYHRFLACALLGIRTVPVDKPAFVRAPGPRPAGRYVPPHLRKRGGK